MSKIKNGGLDQYGSGPFEQQQFGTAGVEGVNTVGRIVICKVFYHTRTVMKILAATRVPRLTSTHEI